MGKQIGFGVAALVVAAQAACGARDQCDSCSPFPHTTVGITGHPRDAGAHDAGPDLGDAGFPTSDGGYATIARGEIAPSGLAVTESGDVFWLSRELGPNVLTLRHASANGPAQTMFGTLDPPGEPPSLAYRDGVLYYATGARDGGGKIYSDSLDASIPLELAVGQDGPSSIAVDDTSVAWTDLAGGTVQAANRTGAQPQTLASGQPQPASVALVGGVAVWIDAALDGGAALARPLDGGPLATLASCGATGLCAPTAAAAAGDSVLVATRDAGFFLVPLDGGPALHAAWLDGGAADVRHLAGESDGAFFTDTSAGLIGFVGAQDGGLRVAPLASDTAPTDLARSQLSVYWLSAGATDGGVRRMAR